MVSMASTPSCTRTGCNPQADNLATVDLPQSTSGSATTTRRSRSTATSSAEAGGDPWLTSPCAWCGASFAAWDVTSGAEATTGGTGAAGCVGGATGCAIGFSGATTLNRDWHFAHLSRDPFGPIRLSATRYRAVQLGHVAIILFTPSSRRGPVPSVATDACLSNTELRYLFAQVLCLGDETADRISQGLGCRFVRAGLFGHLLEKDDHLIARR